MTRLGEWPAVNARLAVRGRGRTTPRHRL